MLLAGVDEAGRGALAGPVVSAAVILTPDISHKILKDSKILSKNERKKIYDLIMEKTPFVGIGIVSEVDVDNLNVLQATLLSMEKAVTSLSVVPDEILIDGREAPELPMCKVKTIVKGDCYIPEISAASIVAKETRDKIMLSYHKEYPQYYFSENNGYGTEKHYEAIYQHGISKIHRRSFNLNKQMRLFNNV